MESKKLKKAKKNKTKKLINKSSHDLSKFLNRDGIETIDLQIKVAAEKRAVLKVRSRIKSGLAKLRHYDELIEELQEKIIKSKGLRRQNQSQEFDWCAIQTAHLISKVFEHCKPVSAPGDLFHSQDSSQSAVSKCHYTEDFHRFAVTLYFFSPKAYFFLKSIVPLFPSRQYIQSWANSGHMEKLFPAGVWRDEFNQ